METKVCNKCKILKSVEEFNKDKRAKNGLRSWCKSCDAEYKRQYYIDNSEKKKEQDRQYRINNPEKIKEYLRQYYIKNREKLDEFHRQYLIKCPDKNEKKNEYRKRYYINNLEKEKEYQKQHRIDNPEKFKERERLYRLNNHEKHSSQESKRRALIRNATIENVDLLQLYENHKWVCGLCGLKIDKKLRWPDPGSVSHDHILPISKGGSHTYDNIQPAHLKCNQSKRDKVVNIQLRLLTA